jgi:putative ABC transport system permease protein
VRLRQSLVVAQVALSLILLSGAGLMARSFVRLASVDPGFVAEGVLTFRLSLPSRQYPEDVAAVAFHDRLIERLRALPGVEQVGGTRDLPLSGRSGGDVLIREDHLPAEGEVPPVVWATRVTPTYFETLGIPLLRGRGITRQDQEEEAPVVVLDQAAVDIFFGGANPIGERIRLGVDPSKDWLEVVGVVGSTKRETLAEAPTPMAYISTSIESFNSARLMSYALRLNGGASGLSEALRSVVASMDPDLPIIGLRSMDRVVAEAEAPMAFTMIMIGIAAAVALLLGSVGVYGVVSYIVSHRTPEIGIRMALGATGADVRRLLLGQGAVVGALGLAIGLAGSLLLAGAVESQLYGTDPLDPATHVATSLVLLVVVLLATWVPARRASRIDPNVALRAD